MSKIFSYSNFFGLKSRRSELFVHAVVATAVGFVLVNIGFVNMAYRARIYYIDYRDNQNIVAYILVFVAYVVFRFLFNIRMMNTVEVDTVKREVRINYSYWTFFNRDIVLTFDNIVISNRRLKLPDISIMDKSTKRIFQISARKNGWREKTVIELRELLLEIIPASLGKK